MPVLPAVPSPWPPPVPRPWVRGGGGTRGLLLVAGGARGGEGAAIASGVGHYGQADAGVARGALDDAPAGPQQPLGLGVADHEEGGAVLHGLAGIHEFGLGENLAAGQFAGAVE